MSPKNVKNDRKIAKIAGKRQKYQTWSKNQYDGLNFSKKLQKTLYHTLFTWKYLMNHRSCYTGVILFAVSQRNSDRRRVGDF